MTVAGPQFANIGRAVIGNPDVGTIEGTGGAIVSPGSEGSEQVTVAGPQLADSGRIVIGDPHDGPVKTNPRWTVSHGECSQHGTIAGTQLGHIVAVGVGHPDVGAVEG